MGGADRSVLTAGPAEGTAAPTGHDDVGTVRIEHLRSFVVLAQELHFARAAARLGVTSGCISRRVARLERALGLPLVLRTTRRVWLTEAGRRLLAVAQRLVGEVETLVRSAGATGSPAGSSGRPRPPASAMPAASSAPRQAPP